MTKQARKVIDSCGFPVSEIRQIEGLVCRFTANQIINLVRAKDKMGEHESVEWFLPFFNGYIRQTLHFMIGDSDLWWSVYDEICDFVEDFDVDDIHIILELSMDTTRMRRAIGSSKPFIKYVYSVFKSMKPTEVKTFNTVDVEIKRHKIVKTQIS